MGSQSATRTITEGSFSDALSTLQIQLFRNTLNTLVTPSSDVYRYDSSYPKLDYNPAVADHQPESSRTGSSSIMLSGAPPALLAPSGFSLNELLPPSFAPPLLTPATISHPFNNLSAAAVYSSMQQSKRPRSEKKPIPENQKDAKYYERRKRNNKAAKKSRDARKLREDHIALRATFLEHDNAYLRAELIRLRDECQALKHQLVLVKHRSSPIAVPTSDSKSALTPVASLSRQV